MQVVDAVARATLTQVFANPTEQALEVTYVFPVLPSATVCGLTADLGGSRVEGRVLTKPAARAEYESAKAQNRTACLLEKPGGDLLKLRLGRLPAGKEVVVRLELVLSVQNETDGSLRVALPTVVGARYPL